MVKRLALCLLVLAAIVAPTEAAKLQYLKGSTSVFVDVFIQDSSSTTGAGLTGLTNASSGLVCYYARSDQGNAGGTQISLASATRGTYTAAGFVEKDAPNMPGVYELGLPTGVLATGANYAVVMCKGATNMAPLVLEIQLAGIDIQDAVHAGLSAIPNASPGAANGVLIAGTNAPVTITGSGTALSLISTGANGSGLVASGNGSGHGVIATGGASAGDGIRGVLGSGGADIRGNITGSLSGSVASCTGCTTAGGTTIMPEVSYVKDVTSLVREIFIKDSTTNLGKTGLTNASSGLTISFGRSDQGNAGDSTCTPQAATRGSYTSCGFVEKDASNAPGWYQFGVPTAMVASGAPDVRVSFYGVAGTTPTQLPIALVDVGLLAINTKLGTPAGATMSADIAALQTTDTAIKAKTDSFGFTGGLVNAITNGYASGQSPLQPTTAGRTLDVGASGGAGLDWANIKAPTTTVGLSGTTVGAATTVTNLTNAPTAGDLTATMKTSVTTAATNSTPTAAAVTGAVGSVTGGVGGNVGGNVAGSVGSVTGNVGGSVGSIANKVGTYRKNVAGQVKFPLFMRDSTNPATAKSGVTLTVTVSKDGGAFGPAGGTAAEIGSGHYTFAPSQLDTDCDLCDFRVTASGALDTGYTIHTAP